jgi:hypothetical protein
MMVSLQHDEAKMAALWDKPELKRNKVSVSSVAEPIKIKK